MLAPPQKLQRLSEDPFCCLPDEILCCIVSLLPYESALQTSFVSTRWRSLWKKDLIGNGKLEDIAKEVESFVAHFDELDPLKHPRRLRFHFNHGCVLSATIAPFNKLLLDFFSTEEAQESPKQFSWILRLRRQNFNYYPSDSTLLVKTLHLTSVSHLTSDVVSSIIPKLQLLESLKITNCNGLESVRIISHQKLRNLTILDCPQLQSLYVFASKLQCLRFRGLLPQSLIRSRYLEDAMIDVRQGPGSSSIKRFCFGYYRLIRALLNVQILTLCRWTVEKLVIPWLSSRQVLMCSSPRCPDLGFNKLKELWWIDTSIREDNIDVLLSFLKLCPSLERLFINIDPTSYDMPSMGECSNQVDLHTQLDHLKVVKLEGVSSEDDRILLAERLLEVITTEPVIIATAHGCNGLRILRMSANQQILGEKKMVKPKGKDYAYEFVEETEDVDRLCCKHAHMAL